MAVPPSSAGLMLDTSWMGRRIHFIGVAGSGMRGLAEVLLARGARVSGSDRCDGPALERLRDRGARVWTGQREDSLPADVDAVVISAAVKEQNPELQAARARGVPVHKYASMVGRVMQSCRGVAICGTHGKSTTTAMTAFAMREAGLSPSFVVGAEVAQLGGPSGVGDGDLFVVEACEYDRSFHNLHPHCAALLNIEEDHLDCYRNLDDIIQSFAHFAGLIPPDGLLVANGECRAVAEAVRSARCTVETFGTTPDCTWQAADCVVTKGRFSFDVCLQGRKLGRAELHLPGLHNVFNALASFAVCHYAGVPVESMLDSLLNFRGADRRCQLLGNGCGVSVVDDYAHHPTEIVASLRALKDHHRPNRLICVFQPHQHSRTRHLMDDFAQALTHASIVLVPDIYFVRDSEDWKQAVNAADLVGKIRRLGGQAEYIPTFHGISNHLKTILQEGDLLVTMGAGNVNEVAEGILQWLGAAPAA